MKQVFWTEYLHYRIKLRGFNLDTIEHIVKYSNERYYDESTNRKVVVGKHDKTLIMIPYEENEDELITPITVHATSRQQINYRLKCERFSNE